MQITSGAGLQPLRSADIALRLLQTAQNSSPTAPDGARVSPSDDVNSLLQYAKTASASKAVTAPEQPYDPANDLPDTYEIGDLVDVDTLDPVYRDFARSVGATHVRLYGRAEVDDATFQAEVSAALDEWYAGDPAYLAAKAEGNVTIRRQSDVMAELGETRFGSQDMAFYRQGGKEHFGSGGTGIPSEKFNQWWMDQNAAGMRVTPGGTNGLNFVATWQAGAP